MGQYKSEQYQPNLWGTGTGTEHLDKFREVVRVKARQKIGRAQLPPRPGPLPSPVLGPDEIAFHNRIRERRAWDRYFAAVEELPKWRKRLTSEQYAELMAYAESLRPNSDPA